MSVPLRHPLDPITPEAGGPPLSWKQLFDAEFRGTCRFLGRLGVDPPDVEDAAQQVFFVAHRRANELQGIDNPAAWIRGIALRVAREHFRWRKVRRIGRKVIKLLHEVHHQPPMSPERWTSAVRTTAVVRECLAELSPKLREVLVLCEFEQANLAEAASILNVPLNTVRSRRLLARQALRERLEKKLGGHAVAALEANEWPFVGTT
ncbi:MAG: RNA polymerase sigma factor [Deltaproteobacteria bacterium]|nr:RNA polymerase sigma factor [Deltaproteobacteria bacterium]